MPHLTLEHSDNVIERIDLADLFGRLHRSLAEAGGYKVDDFKSRAVEHRCFFAGDGSFEQAFINLDIRTFAGKSAEQKVLISRVGLEILAAYFTESMARFYCDLSVQVTEIDRASYSRARSGGSKTA